MSAVFGVIVDLSLTIPKTMSKVFYIDRLYQNDTGVSVVITDAYGNIAGSLYDCTTFDHPVIMDQGTIPGVTVHVILSPSNLRGDLISNRVQISPALISTYELTALPTQTVELIQDGNTVYSSVLTANASLELLGILEGSVSNTTLTVSSSQSAGTEYTVDGYNTNPPLRMINNTYIPGGTVTLIISSGTTSAVSGGTTTYINQPLVSSAANTVNKTVELDFTAQNDLFNPVNIIDSRISPAKEGREYKHFPLDDLYYYNANTGKWRLKSIVELCGTTICGETSSNGVTFCGNTLYAPEEPSYLHDDIYASE